ncbi:MAG: hypothetical protein JXA23_00510 [Bacteroidales bacterium]|nr:hypothetical protein [Bacteroidales bacterium]
MATVLRIKPEARKVVTNIGEISYDFLVIASGSTSNFYGKWRLPAHLQNSKSTLFHSITPSWIPD